MATRKNATRSQTIGIRLESPDIATDSSDKTEEARDPAHVAMARLLAKALAASNTTLEEAGQNGSIVVIQVPAAEWTDIAVQEWQAEARGGNDPEHGFRDRSWREKDWICWAPDEAERSDTLKDGADKFAAAVAKGRHCCGIAADLSWLPADIVHCADHHLCLASLTSADVIAVAREVFDDLPTETISDADAAMLTPRVLRLSRRPGQTANAYMLKLTGLLMHDRRSAEVRAPKPEAASIREAPTLERLHGMAEAVAWGLSLAEDLSRYMRGELPWSAVDRGVLLSGRTGCGKTLFARALAASCGVPLISGTYGQWHASGMSHQGDLLKAMRKTFAEARKAAPAILFIDEVDSFPNRATIRHHYREFETQVVNALLSEIDGVEGRDGVVLVAACNDPARLDPALVRAGRLDHHIRVHMPDRRALASILREHLCGELADTNLDGAALAALGSSGADIEKLVRGARRRSRDAGRPLRLADLMAEIGGTDERTTSDLYVSAVHEAGHAAALCDLLPGSLQAVTLRPSEASVGGATIICNTAAFMSQRDIRHRLIVALAGRAAEEVIFGVPSSSAGGGDDSDLAQATKLAAAAAVSLGLDETVGLLWSGTLDHGRNLFRIFGEQPRLAVRIREVIDEAYADALTLARQRSPAIRALAARLIDKRVVDGREVAAIAAAYPADPACGGVP